MSLLSAQQASSPQIGALALAAENAAAGVSGTSSASAATSSDTSAAGGNDALSSLSGNFQNFLSMLMTQLQNQDPTSPLDTNQFTSELVQFSSVEQQIDTNKSLTQLIQLTQAGEVLQSSSMVGHQVAVQSNQLSLQNGTASLQFTATTAGPAVVAVYNSNGTEVAEQTVQAQAGANTWAWNGALASGGTAPDGPYNVAVAGTDASGKTVQLPFTVIGTATGVQSQSGGLQLELGGLSVNFSAVKSVLNGS
ncbi:MAG TPA: flagellar hook capping FlgD N-terminal domain-containing protein [Acetobacteraceae bacterium]|nr:flagellar hook capping FlgD N-terminal domain-containing protein [Acetobacteraceae bacterium]